MLDALDKKSLNEKLITAIRAEYPQIASEVVAAIRVTLRHHFVTPTFTTNSHGTRILARDEPEAVAAIYQNQVLVYRTKENKPSTNSSPGFIASLIHRLGVQSGEQVLEVGAGAGWVTAILAQLTGQFGFVVGVEVIDELAQQSRDNLAALGISNTHIVNGDILNPAALKGKTPKGGFDKILLTTSAFTISNHLFDALKTGGVIGLPLRDAGDCATYYFLRKKDDNTLVASADATKCFFVPITGPKGDGDFTGVRRFPIAARALMRPGPVIGKRHAFVGGTTQDFINQARDFIIFLSRTSPRDVVQVWDLASGAPLMRTNIYATQTAQFGFGLWDRKQGTLVVYSRDAARGYGKQSAVQALFTIVERSLRNWTAQNKPNGTAFGLTVHKHKKPDTPRQGQVRGKQIFEWRMPGNKPG
jgi:protein-L-isoaspartate(D-aspartate) O-methyltransferase